MADLNDGDVDPGTLLGGDGDAAAEAAKAAAEAAKAAEGDAATKAAAEAAEAAKAAEGDAATKAAAEAAKAAEGDAATKAAAEAAKAAKAKAPDSYSEFKLPEGFVWQEGHLEAVQKAGKESGMSQEVMQSFIDLSTKGIQDGIQDYEESGQQQWEDLKDGWVETIKKDPELGGDNLEATIKDGRRAVSAFGQMIEVKGEDGKPVLGKDGKPTMANDLAQALEFTGAGSHPVIVRAFAMLGKLVGEGGMVHGNMMPHNQPTAQRLYAKSKMNP